MSTGYNTPRDIYNAPNPNYTRSFLPANPQPIGSILPEERFPQNEHVPKLFQPLTIRGVEFKNRLWAAPTCLYSSDNGHATDFHLVHHGSLALRGIGAICCEATAVLPEGRISPEDAGLWTDSQIAPLKRVVDFVHGEDTKFGIQLAHAGRKASTMAPWVAEIKAQGEEGKTAKGMIDKSNVVVDERGGWGSNVKAPSAIAFAETYPLPKEMTKEDIAELKDAFVSAVRRAKEVGVDFLQIHGAHGYLFHNFVSPLSNHRTDEYGGSLGNRLRLPLEIVALVRKEWDGPLFYRVSATDWHEGEEKADDKQDGEGWNYWGIQQTTILVNKLKELGVDLVDTSSGGNFVGQKIPTGPLYQVPFAAELKEKVPGILIGAVGLITTAEQAAQIIDSNQADVVHLARQLLRNADFPLSAAQNLGVAVQPAVQYARAWTRMLAPKNT